MSAPAVRASDSDRERTIALLREHSAAGRLTLEEFTERMSDAYEARTLDELAGLARDLPAGGSAVSTRRRPTRLLVSLLGSTERDGRIRVRRVVGCVTALGNVDLDLRGATIERDVITIVALGLFATIDVYVPEGVEVDAHGLALFGHKRTNGNDPAPQPGTPLVRVYAFGLFAGIDVWRVPVSWTQRSWRQVIKGIRAGEHRELEA
jgi:hypothetical protein